MDRSVTIFTGYNLQEVYQIRNWLEAEDIECFLQDELTVQVTQYSNAFGGVKVRVQENDAVRAVEVLEAYGYSQPNASDPYVLLNKIEQRTSKIPFVKRLSVLQKLLVIALIITAILGAVFYLLKPSTYETVTAHAWCVDKIYYKGQIVGPHTTGVKVLFVSPGFQSCNESMIFRTNNDVILPGINSRSIWGNWRFDKNEEMIFISKTDTLQSVYNNKYEVDVSFNSLILRSPNTVIYAHSQ